MKEYKRVKEWTDVALAEDIKKYADLIGGGSAVLFYLDDRKNTDDSHLELILQIAKKCGIECDLSKPTTTVKEVAESLHKQVQKYRLSMPHFVEHMFEDGLCFLEKLCKKYR